MNLFIKCLFLIQTDRHSILPVRIPIRTGYAKYPNAIYKNFEFPFRGRGLYVIVAFVYICVIF